MNGINSVKIYHLYQRLPTLRTSIRRKYVSPACSRTPALINGRLPGTGVHVGGAQPRPLHQRADTTLKRPGQVRRGVTGGCEDALSAAHCGLYNLQIPASCSLWCGIPHWGTPRLHLFAPPLSPVWVFGHSYELKLLFPGAFWFYKTYVLEIHIFGYVQMDIVKEIWLSIFDVHWCVLLFIYYYWDKFVDC